MSDAREGALSRREFLAAAAAAAAATAGTAVAATGSAASAVPAEVAPAAGAGTVPFAQAVARALKDAGTRVVTNVPASACSELYDAWAWLEGKEPVYSFNEEVAFTVAHGAALAGARSAAVLKSHGLAKAGNAVVDSLTPFTVAGCVVVVSDDPLGSHSDNVFDGEALFKGFGLEYRRTTAATVYRDVLWAMARSEEIFAPVALLFDAAEAAKSAVVGSSPLAPSPLKYERDVVARVIGPPLAPLQYRIRKAQRAGEDWRKVPRPPLLEILAGLPRRWQGPVQAYFPLFNAFRTLRSEEKVGYVAGDAGLGAFFAFPPFDCIDVCTYYGGSLPLAIGAWMAGHERPWVVAGDFAFLAGGGLGLTEALHRGAPLKVLVLYNGKAETTGGQPMSKPVFEQLLGGYRAVTRTLHHPEDPAEALKELRTVHRAPGLQIVVADYV